jgi:hypothetical protein
MIAVKYLSDIEIIRDVSEIHYNQLKEELTRGVARAGGEDPDTNGFFVYFSENDVLELIGNLDCEEAMLTKDQGGIYFSEDFKNPKWEAVHAIHSKEDRSVLFYFVFVVVNNEMCMAYVIPNESWVPTNLLDRLDEYVTHRR